MKLFPGRNLTLGSVFLGTLVAVCTAVPTASWADLPRPPGWEPSCTIEKEQAKGGGPCEDARGWRDPDARQDALAAKGYTRRCTEGGAASYVAVWCKSAADGAAPTSTPTNTPTATATATATNAPAAPPTVAPASDNRKSGGLCSVQVIGQDKPSSFFAVLGALLVGFGAARRRSRTPEGSYGKPLI